MLDPDKWVKSSYSGGNGDCVELATHGSLIAVRDSKNPDGPRLYFTRSEWDAFRRGLIDGEFDSL
ncbi:DUF397 domain-containing protein [Nonomuraea guangzhouensis]|uniref:DUF397 domain-containing protein n=1 Tax=Nonomuraea guangzhouensis TaxID=1291555 RepID=A0ABW4GWN4_9ACTN|nr:DUF397 domain-containing protein [Nonomuraea guangzhouensis]